MKWLRQSMQMIRDIDIQVALSSIDRSKASQMVTGSYNADQDVASAANDRRHPFRDEKCTRHQATNAMPTIFSERSKSEQIHLH